MEDLSPVNRPVTLGEIATAFGMSAARLKRLADRQGVKPACRIGRTQVYGPRQIRRLHAALVGRETAGV